MLTREQILAQIKSGELRSHCDGVDFHRLCKFFPLSDWAQLGYAPEEDYLHSPLPLTEENVREELTYLVRAGFARALGKHSLATSFLYHTIRMWLQVAQSPVDAGYEYYALPLLRAVALEWNLPCPIGDDLGTEEKYR